VKKTVIYCRVAASAQSKQDYSFDAQEKVCRDYAEENDYQVEKVFKETNSTADKDRPVLQELLEFVKINRVYGTIVRDFSRISRDSLEYAGISSKLHSVGTKIISATQNNDPTIIERVISSISDTFQQINDLHSEKIKKGIKHSKLQRENE
jgi:DNA invertase Pin-like site-specific DNA recombinase